MDLMADAVVNVNSLVSTRLPYLYPTCVWADVQGVHQRGSHHHWYLSVHAPEGIRHAVCLCLWPFVLSRLSNVLQRLNRPPKARTQLATAGLGTECLWLTLGEQAHTDL